MDELLTEGELPWINSRASARHKALGLELQVERRQRPSLIQDLWRSSGELMFASEREGLTF